MNPDGYYDLDYNFIGMSANEVSSISSLMYPSHAQEVKNAKMQISDSPGHPFKNVLLKDKFTIDNEAVGNFLGNNGHSIQPINLMPILQSSIN